MFSYSISGYLYLQQSLMRPPTIPRMFGDSDTDILDQDITKTDVFGQPFIPYETSQPPFVSGVLNSMCDFSELLYKIMSYNGDKTLALSSEADVKTRREFYGKMKDLLEKLPPRLQAEKNFTPQTCFLK